MIQKKKGMINIDGQTSRGTAGRHLRGIHLINAWSAENEICLAQSKVDDKSNEITAIPELMDMLDLKGAIITTDALNTQKTIVAKANRNGGDYLLPVKGNQPLLRQQIEEMFQVVDEERAIARVQWERALEKAKGQRDQPRLTHLLEKGASSCGAFFWQPESEKSHGRIETRKHIAIPAIGLPLRNEWENIQSVVRVERERILGDKVEREIVYYISSLFPKEIRLIAEACRGHWRVENSLHWRLDVVFRQDHSRYRNRVGAHNLATIRKIGLNALCKETSLKGGLATKQCAAACNPEYRDKVVNSLLTVI